MATCAPCLQLLVASTEKLYHLHRRAPREAMLVATPVRFGRANAEVREILTLHEALQTQGRRDVLFGKENTDWTAVVRADVEWLGLAYDMCMRASAS